MKWIGSLSKALLDAAGVPHLIYLVTGPEEDRQGEYMGKAAVDKVEALGKACQLFLTPSHDTPITLAKSTDAYQDDTGHLMVDFTVDASDPMGMRVFKSSSEAGGLVPTVSLGAERVTRIRKADGVEISDIDDSLPVHVALAFPGRNVYQKAGLVSALHKALKADPSDLLKRGWPETAVKKALDPITGDWIPPSFSERWAAKELQDDLPDMLDLFRWTIEDAVSPYSTGTPEEKRARVMQSCSELCDACLGEMDESMGAGTGKAGEAPAAGMAKTEGEATPAASDATQSGEESAPAVPAQAPTEGTSEATPEATPAATDPPPVTPTAGEEVMNAVKALLQEALAPLHADLQGVKKAIAREVSEPAGVTTDPATAPHTGRGSDTQPDAARTEAIKALNERESELRKAIGGESHSGRKSRMIQEHSAVLARLNHLTEGA